MTSVVSALSMIFTASRPRFSAHHKKKNDASSTTEKPRRSLTNKNKRLAPDNGIKQFPSLKCMNVQHLDYSILEVDHTCHHYS